MIDGALGVTTAATLGRRVLATAERLLQMWERPLGEVSVLLDDEAAPLRAVDAATPPAALSIHARFAAIAERMPDKLAVSWAGGTLSYRELDTAADRLAAGAGCPRSRRETPVAIKLSRSPQYIVAMLAMLKAGAMCVPLEPGMPPERVDSILRQSGATIVVDERLLDAAETRQRLPPGRRGARAGRLRRLHIRDHGRTQGRHRDSRRSGCLRRRPSGHVLRPAAARLGRPLRIAHAWSFAFDAAWQPLVALLDGHAVHVVDEHTQTDAEALVGSSPSTAST